MALRGGAAALGALLLAACVGVTSRADFDAEIRARGGGFDDVAVRAAVDRVAEDLGPDFEVLALLVSPVSGTVAIRARRPGTREVDAYTFSHGTLRDVSPVRVRPDADLEGTVVAVTTFDLAALGGIVTEALARSGVGEGHVSSIRLATDPDPEQPGARIPLVTVDVEGPRSAAQVRFAPDGRFVDQEAS